MATKKDFSASAGQNAHLNMQYGKLPPQAVELEEAVLGAVMLENEAIFTVMDLIKPDVFYKESHCKIYNAIMNLQQDEKPIDILTVTEELRKNGELESVGGPFFISQLTSKVASAAHVEIHARIITQKFIQRELIRVSSDIQSRAYDESTDVDDLMNYSESQLFEIAEGNIKKSAEKIKPILKAALLQIEEASKRKDKLSGAPSGFTEIDRITSGWQSSDLIIVAARPSMGKTAFVLSMTRKMAIDHNTPVGFFSLEMSSVSLVNRLIVAETGIKAEKIRNGDLLDFEWEQLDHKIKDLENAPIYIDDTPAISIFELRAKARRLKRKHDIGIIFIDYLQLMTGPPETRGNREQEVSTISRNLKAVAKELNIPIVALSQLNRSVETRGGDKRPQLSDLRESGAIEQDADLVLFIHRPEYYGILTDDDGNSMHGIAQIIIAKHRNGAVGDVPLKFSKETASFEELSQIDSFDGAVDDSSNAVIYKSKMNQEPDKQDKKDPGTANFEIDPNKDLDNGEAPF